MIERTRQTTTLVLSAVLLLGACSVDAGESSSTNSSLGSAEASTTVATVEEAPVESDEDAADVDLVVAVRDWTPGQPIPVDFTCDGADRSPQVTLTAVPEGTASLALVVDDPDAPGDQPFVHWVVYNMDVTTREIAGGEAEFTYGRNDFGVSEWSGPCPPEGDGVHTYRWRLFALDERLGLEPDLDGRAFEAAIEGHVLETALFPATYER